MRRYIMLSLLTSLFVTLQSASSERPEHSPRTEPLSIIDMRTGNHEYVSDYDIGHDNGATDADFNMLYYPKDNPFIVLGQKQAAPKGHWVVSIHNERVPTFADAIAVKTELTAVRLGGALLLLHSKSGNHKNLAFVQENFLKPFLIEDLSCQAFNTILSDQLHNLSAQMKLYEEQAVDTSTAEGKKAFQFAKALRQKDDFVKCRMSYLAFDSYGTLRSSEYKFGLPQRTSERNEVFSDFFKLTTSYRNLSKERGSPTTLVLGLTCKNCIKEKQGILQRNVDRLGLLLATHKYGHEIKKGLKNDAQASFIMLDLKDIAPKASEIQKEISKKKERDHKQIKQGRMSSGISSKKADRERTDNIQVEDLREFLDELEEGEILREHADKTQTEDLQELLDKLGSPSFHGATFNKRSHL